MTIDNKIKDKKLQYDMRDREAAKKAALLSGKINKHEYLMGEDILPSEKSRIIEQAKFSPLGKAFEIQTKTIKDQGEKEIKTIKEHGKQ